MSLKPAGPDGWCDADLSELVPKIVDGSHAPPPRVDSGMPMLSAQNIGNFSISFDGARGISPEAFAREHQRTSVASGDVLLTIVGTIGRTAVVPERAAFTLQRSVAVLRPLGVESKFLAYQLAAPHLQRWFREQARGTAQKGVYLKVLARLPLRLAPLTEQCRIVAEIEQQFTRLDAAVSALSRAKASLKRYRTAVLDAACSGRLVPTEAEVASKEGRYFEPADVLLQRVAKPMLASSSDRTSSSFTDWRALQQLPSGWTWASVGQLADIVQYGTSAKSSEVGEIPVLRMGNIRDGSIDASSLKFLPSGHPDFPNLLLRAEDLLFNRTNSPELVGKSAVYHGNPPNASFASYLIRVRFRRACYSDFISHLLNSTYGRAWVVSVVSQQVGQANVNGTKLQSLHVPLPPLAEQHRIVAEVDRRLSIIRALETTIDANLKRADRLRQSILKRAFEGKLVPQDPNDEPASILLDRIRAERAASQNGKTNIRRLPKRTRAHPLFDSLEPASEA